MAIAARINAVVAVTVESGIAVVSVDSPPVNALSAQVREGIAAGLQAAIDDPDVRAIVLICSGRTFFAGADISEFGKPLAGPPLPQIAAMIEDSPKRVVAAIHGTALGGGLEIALACHYRISDARARYGLPEVKLGLLPGAGGTQRLTRLIGVEQALDMITSGTPVDAARARQLGIVDDVVEEEMLREAAISTALALEKRHAPIRRTRDVTTHIDTVRDKPELFENFRTANARRFRGMIAPDHIIRCVQAAANLPFEEGMALERQSFDALVSSEQSRALRYVFFAERQAWKVPDLPPDTAILPVHQVGIIGAGTMGGGIAMNFANAGLSVMIVETSQAALDRGLATIRGNYESSARKGRISDADVVRRMDRIEGTLDLDSVRHCDLIIEAVFESMAVKQDVFKKLDRIAKPGAILATNTSFLDVDELARGAARPECVIGLHFFSPANVMRLLEIVRGRETAPAVVATAMQLARRIGKVGVLVGVCHGFVGNRMLAQRQREATRLVLEGAMPWDVDRVLYEFGMPMGPFAMSDLAGLDVGQSDQDPEGGTLESLLCAQGRRGQKTSAGFYDYDRNRVATPSRLVEDLVVGLSADKKIVRRMISDQEILERCLYPMINEGAKILEEGVAIRSSDIDTIWINGYGWPAYRGGPMYYADQVGPDKVLARMRDFERDHGAEFKPAALLERLADENRYFQEP